MSGRTTRRRRKYHKNNVGDKIENLIEEEPSKADERELDIDEPLTRDFKQTNEQKFYT
jgi:hypothetical protein